MTDRTVARRYAEAFVRSLESAGRVDQGLEEIKGITLTYMGSRQMQNFLGSPEIGEEEKQKLLKRLFAEEVGPQEMGLLELLLKKDRFDHLPVISEEAVSVAEARRGVIRGVATTARPISSAETEKLAKAVGKLLGKKVLLERAVDTKLIGGVRVTVGTDLLDGSVQTLLENAKRHLLSVKVSD